MYHQGEEEDDDLIEWVGERADDGLWEDVGGKDQSQACRPHPAAGATNHHDRRLPLLNCFICGSSFTCRPFTAPYCKSSLDGLTHSGQAAAALSVYAYYWCMLLHTNFIRLQKAPLLLPAETAHNVQVGGARSILSIVSLSFSPSIHHVIDSAVQCNAAACGRWYCCNTTTATSTWDTAAMQIVLKLCICSDGWQEMSISCWHSCSYQPHSVFARVHWLND